MCGHKDNLENLIGYRTLAKAALLLILSKGVKVTVTQIKVTC